MHFSFVMRMFYFGDDSASIVLRGFMSYNNKTCEITMHSGVPKLWFTVGKKSLYFHMHIHFYEAHFYQPSLSRLTLFRQDPNRMNVALDGFFKDHLLRSKARSLDGLSGLGSQWGE